MLILKIIYLQQLILEILTKFRNIIAHYIKDTYIIEDISVENEYATYAIDENLFVTINNNQKWIVGIINTISKKLRLEITELRNTETMKKIISTHVKKGNIIVSDAWAAYSWLDDMNSGYIHHVHNHGHGDFGFGIDSTSHRYS